MRFGKLPQWSMWAWLSRTASTSLARNGKSLFRARLSARRPWKSPQSSKSVRPAASRRCIEPVTVCAAPQKVTVGSAGGLRFLSMPVSYRTVAGLCEAGLTEAGYRKTNTRDEMARMAKVVVSDTVVESLEHERRVLGDVAEIAAIDSVTEDALWGHVDDADAFMFYHPLPLTERTIARMKSCKVIVRCGVGYDNVDIAFARRRGIP